LKYLVQAGFQAELFFDDGDQHINTDGDPHLGLDRIGCGAVKGFDMQMLFDPFEEQFDQPAELVQPGDGVGRHGKIVGQEEKSFVGFEVDIMDAAQRFGVRQAAFGTFQADGLIAAQTSILIDRLRAGAGKSQVVFGPGDEEGSLLMDVVKTSKIDVAFVHDIKGAGFEKDMIEKMDIVRLPACNAYKRGNLRMQVELRMDLDGAFVPAMLSPGKQGQAQIDDSGIQGVNRPLEIHPQRFLGVQLTRLLDQNQTHVAIDAPVALFVGLGQRVARDSCLDAGMIELWPDRPQTNFDVAQRLSAGQLGKSHAVKVIETSERFHPMIAAISIDASFETPQRKKIHDLRKNSSTVIHDWLLKQTESQNNTEPI
jgi:hypothetical protein